MKKAVADFLDFIREKGVVGLAIGFLIGGAVTKLANSFVENLVNPFVGVLAGDGQSLAEATVFIGSIEIFWGKFAGDFINFLIICAVVYFGFRLIGLERFDKKRE